MHNLLGYVKKHGTHTTSIVMRQSAELLQSTINGSWNVADASASARQSATKLADELMTLANELTPALEDVASLRNF